MNEPRRLREQGADAFECDLILSASRDTPEPAALRRTLSALGVGLGLPLGTVGAAQGAVVPVKLGAAVLTKWLVTGVALGVVSAGGAKLGVHALDRSATVPRDSGVEVVRANQPPRAALAPTPAAAVASAGDGASEIPLPPGVPLGRSVPTLPAPSVTPELAPAPSRAVEPPDARPEDSLKREVTAVDDARRALARGDATSALASLESYERSFPGGALLPEARVLEVRALLATGQRARAELLAERVIGADPVGPHADAVRALLARTHNR